MAMSRKERELRVACGRSLGNGNPRPCDHPTFVFLAGAQTYWPQGRSLDEVYTKNSAVQGCGALADRWTNARTIFWKWSGREIVCGRQGARSHIQIDVIGECWMCKMWECCWQIFVLGYFWAILCCPIVVANLPCEGWFGGEGFWGSGYSAPSSLSNSDITVKATRYCCSDDLQRFAEGFWWWWCMHCLAFALAMNMMLCLISGVCPCDSRLPGSGRTCWDWWGSIQGCKRMISWRMQFFLRHVQKSVSTRAQAEQKCTPDIMNRLNHIVRLLDLLILSWVQLLLVLNHLCLEVQAFVETQEQARNSRVWCTLQMI